MALDERPVRLVLMEYIDGQTIQELYSRNSTYPALLNQLDASHIPEEYRLDVVAQILEAQVAMLQAGIEPGPLSINPKTVLIRSHPTRP